MTFAQFSNKIKNFVLSLEQKKEDFILPFVALFIVLQNKILLKFRKMLFVV